MNCGRTSKYAVTVAGRSDEQIQRATEAIQKKQLFDLRSIQTYQSTIAGSGANRNH